MHPSYRVILRALCIAILVAPAVSARQGAPAVPPGVDPKADAILRSMGRTLAAAKSLSFEASETTDQFSPSGQKIQLGKTVKAMVRRPGNISAVVSGDAEDMAYYYRGKTLTIVNNLQRVYAVQDVPPDNIDAMFDFLADRFRITAPLSDLMFTDPYQAMTGHIRGGEYLGLHMVDGTKCHHLAFRQDAIDWQIWIEDGAQPVPRKVVITYKDLPGSPQFAAVLQKWDLTSAAPDAAFEAKIPEGYKRADLQPVEPTTQPSPDSREGR
jgi:hypothetical protein